MRALALVLVLSPALAFAKHHGPAKAHEGAVASNTQPSSAMPARSTVAVQQADDDEKPGSRQKKK